MVQQMWFSKTSEFLQVYQPTPPLSNNPKERNTMALDLGRQLISPLRELTRRIKTRTCNL